MGWDVNYQPLNTNLLEKALAIKRLHILQDQFAAEEDQRRREQDRKSVV